MSVKKRVNKMKIEADAIFTAKVDSLDVNQDNEHGSRTDKVVLSVERLWKKRINGVVSVYTSGGCGVGFEVGKKYLVYAKRDSEGELYTDVCMGTRNIAAADKDLKHLGKPISGLLLDSSKQTFIQMFLSFDSSRETQTRPSIIWF
jgi:hypothetical protein